MLSEDAMKSILVGLLTAAVLTTSSLAAGNVAVVGDVSGKVLVNRGEGFVPVAGSLQLNVGDRVMVGDNSFATLSYAECSVALAKPTVVSVAAVAPCAAGKTEDAGVFVTPTADVVDYTPAATLPWLPIVLIGVGVPVTYFVGKEIFDDEDCVSC
jgi:hypothetical protein